MTKSEFLKRLQALSAALREQIDNDLSDWDSAQSAIAARTKQVHDAHGFDFFVNTYFPHHIRHPDKSALHEYLFDELPKTLQAPDGVRLAIAAPRGEAKSTIVSKLHTLYRIVTKRTRYTLIVMDSIDQAYPMLEAIKTELEFNERLKCDFPKLTGRGNKWQAGTIVTRGNVKVQVAGAGKKLRGLTHGAYRPDFVVLDDIENDENVRKPEQRDKLQSWLEQTILPLGAAGEKLDIVYIGTILHHDSVLNRTLGSPAWQSARFKAVIQMPDNMALWDEWECLYQSKKTEDADKFYLDNKDEMDKGAIVSWSARPILAMMKIRAMSRTGFDSEYQNDPTSGDDAPFAHAINYWGNLPCDVLYFGAVDPSLGKKGAGRDPSAIVIGAYDKKTGRVYIVVADIKKRLPDKIISDVIAYQKQYDCKLWAVESVQFQEFFRTELIRRSQALGIPIPAQAIKPNTDKRLRIETLQPHMANGVLLLHSSQTTLIDQFRHFPKADHDDGPDAVEMVFKTATSFMANHTTRAIHIPQPNFF